MNIDAWFNLEEGNIVKFVGNLDHNPLMSDTKLYKIRKILTGGIVIEESDNVFPPDSFEGIDKKYEEWYNSGYKAGFKVIKVTNKMLREYPWGFISATTYFESPEDVKGEQE